MIIFPHIPKTGGSSLRAALEAAYGKRLLLDYNNSRTLSRSAQKWSSMKLAFWQFSLRQRFDLVYGHFDPAAYSAVIGPRAMFFRDPAKRTVSHYYYLQQRKKLDKVSLAEFAARPQVQNIYAQLTRSRGTAVETLPYVGLTDRYSDSLKLFHAVFGVQLEERVKRVGAIQPPSDALEAVAPFQASNQAVYDRARRRFDQLCKRHL